MHYAPTKGLTAIVAVHILRSKWTQYVAELEHLSIKQDLRG